MHPAPEVAPPHRPQLGDHAHRQRTPTIAQLAEATGLSKAFVSRLERDETSPSVATLRAVCQVLSLPIGSLFESPDHEVVHLADAPHINFGGSLVVEQLLTPRSEAGVQILRSVLEPGASGGNDFTRSRARWRRSTS